jgi:glutathione S-transferase
VEGCLVAARIHGREQQIPYQYKEENPYLKDEEFLKYSPKGLVPCLLYKGQGM